MNYRKLSRIQKKKSNPYLWAVKGIVAKAHPTIKLKASFSVLEKGSNGVFPLDHGILPLPKPETAKSFYGCLKGLFTNFEYITFFCVSTEETFFMKSPSR